MKKGTVVKFKTPLYKEEEGIRMIILDWYYDSDRCLVGDVVDTEVQPLGGTHVYLKNDLVL
jgi:hypothetical protein